MRNAQVDAAELHELFLRFSSRGHGRCNLRDGARVGDAGWSVSTVLGRLWVGGSVVLGELQLRLRSFLALFASLLGRLRFRFDFCGELGRILLRLGSCIRR